MYKVEKLINGITLVSEKNPFVRSTALGIWVKSGSKYEDKSINGISHFIEHMMFKGTMKRSAKELASEMDSIGGHINAFTSKEYTCYYTVTLDNHFEQALDILYDMLTNSKFLSEDIDREKGVIEEEINMYEDSPEEMVVDELQRIVWKKAPLAMPILGTNESVKNINRENLLKFYDEKYSTDNIVISVAGNFNAVEMYQLVNRYFGTWVSNDRYDWNENNIEYNSGITCKDKDIEQLHFCLAVKGFSIDHKDIYPLSILTTVFGGGASSRLFQKIREEKGLTYSIYSYTSSYINTGLFAVYSAMNPTQFEEVIKLILNEINIVKKFKITDYELQITKEHLKSSIILGLESSASRMSSIGKSQLLLGKIRTPDEIIDKINSVTIEHVNSVIDQIFNNNLSLSIVGKTENINLERVKSICQIN